VAPWRPVEEPQPAVVALPRQAVFRQHCIVVLAWWRWRRRHSFAACGNPPRKILWFHSKPIHLGY
jgi:hypothetical protein